MKALLYVGCILFVGVCLYGVYRWIGGDVALRVRELFRKMGR